MHIPDGFLDAKTLSFSAALALAAMALALRNTRRNLPPRRVPLIGITAAFVFAAQMINFPVAGGTSGHLLGGVLSAVLVGPSAAFLVITCVLLVQAFVFADGGILALGANIFNMALVGTIGGFFIYGLVRKVAPGLRGQLLAASFAAWCSVVLAASGCALQLAFSGTVPWNLVFPVMASLHSLIGIGEALITALVLAAIARTRPELLASGVVGNGRPTLELLAFGLLLALGLAVFGAPLASPQPDGLEQTAQTLQFGDKAEKINPGYAPLPDYAMPGISSATLATALAGGIGTVLMFVFSFFLARALTAKAHHAP